MTSDLDHLEASIAMGPEGNFACRMGADDTHLASTTPDVRSFERILNSRRDDTGMHGQRDAVRA